MTTMDMALAWVLRGGWYTRHNKLTVVIILYSNLNGNHSLIHNLFEVNKFNLPNIGVYRGLLSKHVVFYFKP